MKMDKGLKRIWMAVLFSLAAMVLIAGTIEFGASYVAKKAAEEKAMKDERKAWCEENDFVDHLTDNETGEVVFTGCEEFGKPATPVPPQSFIKIDAEAELTAYLEAEKTLEQQKPGAQNERMFFIFEFPRLYICPARPAPYRDGGTTEQQKMIGYMWCVSHGDEKFVTMVEAESRTNPWAVEKLNDGSAGDGFGLCQVDFRYWPEIHQNPQFRTDWKYQARECYRLWRQDVTFYGAKRNNEMIARFWWGGKPEMKG